MSVAAAETRGTVSPAQRGSSRIAASDKLLAAARSDAAEVLRTLDANEAGLSSAQASARLSRYGPNEVSRRPERGWVVRLARTAGNPLTALLAVLAVTSALTGDARAASVMAAIGVLSVALRFAQEFRADAAAARLAGMIRVTATAVRDGQALEVPLRDLVPGDIVHLAAGDIVPADARVLHAKDLFVNQASLTGESLPVEKSGTCANVSAINAPPTAFETAAFMGSSVASGTGVAVVVATGSDTAFGDLVARLAARPPKEAFERGVDRLTWLLVRFMAVMVPLVFVANVAAKHDWRGAFFFALAVAVGLTPEMLPMIVSVCLAKGAMVMSRKRVIVKRLAAIQDLGSMDVLCTDKTGTLTRDRVILARHCDVAGEESDAVLLHAYLVSHFQTGLKNVLDRATLESPEFPGRTTVSGYAKLDELPFDFSRRMMSVALAAPDGARLLVTKGAPEEVLARCTRFELDGTVSPAQLPALEDLKDEYEDLSREGFRVLAVAYRELPERASYSTDDERDLILKGYVAFLDPPKESAAPAIAALHRHGVVVKVLTGDNAMVARTVCRDVGLADEPMLLGHDVERMSDAELSRAAEQTVLFARLAPADKERIIRVLRDRGHVVGFLGDGINDAPALHTADVGISVDTAADVAKGAAAVVLLEKSLNVLDEAVIEGRKVFANILKYVRMGISSNFGNMFSVLGASVFLPFLPLTPIQVLVNSLLYDCAQLPIPNDHVDADELARPRPWNLRQIERFVLWMGPVSSFFDYVMFAVLLWGMGCWKPSGAATFQTGWFVESLVSQTLVIHVIRTRRPPILRSRAAPGLAIATLLIVAVALWLPSSSIGHSLGFVRLPAAYWPAMAGIVLAYLAAAHAMNRWLVRDVSSPAVPPPVQG